MEYGKFLKYKSALYPESRLHPTSRPTAGNTLCNIAKDMENQESVTRDLDTWWYGDQYNAANAEPIISVCENEDGTSGRDYYGTFFFGYHIVLFFFYIVTCCIVYKSGNICVTGRTGVGSQS